VRLKALTGLFDIGQYLSVRLHGTAAKAFLERSKSSRPTSSVSETSFLNRANSLPELPHWPEHQLMIQSLSDAMPDNEVIVTRPPPCRSLPALHLQSKPVSRPPHQVDGRLDPRQLHPHWRYGSEGRRSTSTLAVAEHVDSSTLNTAKAALRPASALPPSTRCCTTRKGPSSAPTLATDMSRYVRLLLQWLAVAYITASACLAGSRSLRLRPVDVSHVWCSYLWDASRLTGTWAVARYCSLTLQFKTMAGRTPNLAPTSPLRMARPNDGSKSRCVSMRSSV
jgi:hypothetical protein